LTIAIKAFIEPIEATERSLMDIERHSVEIDKRLSQICLIGRNVGHNTTISNPDAIFETILEGYNTTISNAKTALKRYKNILQKLPGFLKQHI